MNRFLFIISIITLFTSQSIAAPKPYAPRIELEAKIGNKRVIGRSGVLIPLLQNQNNLFYLTAFGMMDSKSSKEGNFGLGFRWLRTNKIFGFYGFFDIRKSPNSGNVFKQLTLGHEQLYRYFEIRTNLYLPFNEEANLLASTIGNYNYNGVNTELVLHTRFTTEKPLLGFDIEFGLNLAKVPGLSTHLAYYYFFGGRGPSVEGLRLRSQLNLGKYFAIQGEASYDNVRKFSGYIGAKLVASIGMSKRGYAVNSIRDKMTHLPVRDIDIITQQNNTSTMSSLSLNGYHPMIKLPEQREDDNFRLVGNAVFDSMREFNTSPYYSPASGFIVLKTKNLKGMFNIKNGAPDIEILSTSARLVSSDNTIYLENHYAFESEFGTMSRCRVTTMPIDCAKCIDLATVNFQDTDRGNIALTTLLAYRWLTTFEIEHGRVYCANDLVDTRQALIPLNDADRMLFYSALVAWGNASAQTRHRGDRQGRVIEMMLNWNLQPLTQREDNLPNHSRRARQLNELSQETQRIMRRSHNTTDASLSVGLSIRRLADRYNVVQSNQIEIEAEIRNLLVARSADDAPNGLDPNASPTTLRYRLNDARFNKKLRAKIALRAFNSIINGTRRYTHPTAGGINLRTAMHLVYKSVRGDGLTQMNLSNADIERRKDNFIEALCEVRRDAPRTYRNVQSTVRYEHTSANGTVERRRYTYFDDRQRNEGGVRDDAPFCGQGHFHKLVETLNLTDPDVRVMHNPRGLLTNRLTQLGPEIFSQYQNQNPEQANRVLEDYSGDQVRNGPYRNYLSNVLQPLIRSQLREEFNMNARNPQERLLPETVFMNNTDVEGVLQYLDLEVQAE